MKLRYISVPGESHRELEDFEIHQPDGRRLKAAVGDWASDQLGRRYRDEELSSGLGNNMKTEYGGGFIGARVARDAIASSEATGRELVRQINKALERKYKQLGIQGYWADRKLTFLGYIAHLLATFEPRQMILTAVGDVKVAVNGRHVAGKTKKVDKVNSASRAVYVEETDDVDGGYDHVRPLILAQYKFQNTPGDPLSFPAIDGTETLPAEEIEIQTFSDADRVLMWSDGYVMPNELTIEGLERHLMSVYHDDPHRCHEYSAVYRDLDDRTAVEVKFDDWSPPKIENVTKKVRLI